MSDARLSDVRITVKPSADGRSTYEEIEPQVPLAAKVKLGSGIDAGMLAAAQAAVTEMAQDYPGWAAADLDRMRAAAAELRRSGTPEAAHALHALAHDAKGQGGSFGYPLTTLIAGLLCRLLHQRGLFDARVHAAVDAHLDAFGLVLAQRMAGPQAAWSARLGEELGGLVARLA